MDVPKFPSIFHKLVSILHQRHQMGARSYHLFLASTISLTPDVLFEMCGAESWSMFRQYIQNIGQSDRINMLTHYLKPEVLKSGYQALATLIQAGYFSTILTTNLDSLLEDALLDVGVRPGDMQVLLVGRDQADYITAALSRPGKLLTLVKLHGSLREGVLAEHFPDVFQLPGGLGESLKRYLAQDIIIIGSPEHEDDILWSLSALEKNTIYYAPAQGSVNPQDYILRLLQARNIPPDPFVITGPYGEFSTFFQALQHLLQLESGASVEITPVLSPSQPFQLDVPAQKLLSTEPQSGLPEPLPHVDILLVTVTERETRAVLKYVSGTPQLIHMNKLTYFDLGLIGDARVFLVRSGMNSGGVTGSRATVNEALKALNCSEVIMVGIACGMKPAEQQIGDILVSEWLQAYDQQKIGTDPASNEPVVYERGYRVPAPMRLLSHFKSKYVLLDFAAWQAKPQVQFGLILSGDKLIDNEATRTSLLLREPEALGLEMEGAGLYEAAANLNVDWLLIKAISDWGDGHKAHDKEQRQILASENAARFVLQIIQYPVK